MVIMNNPLLSILVFSLGLALIVFLADLVIPPLFGRPSRMMSLVDFAVLALIIAAVVFLLRMLGWWPHFIAGI